MSPELINTLGTIVGVLVAAFGAFLFAFWIAMGIWTFHDIRQRTRDWLVIILAVVLVLVFPLIGLLLYMMIRPKATLADVYDRALEEEALLRELEQTQACYNCGVPVKDVWVYCPNCHSQLQHSCPSCGSLARNDWEICVFCGTAQQLRAPQRRLEPAPQLQTTQPYTPPAPLPPSAAREGVVAQTAPPATRNPFRRQAPPPTDLDDSNYRPMQMPE